MKLYLIKMFGISLILTLVVELAVAFLVRIGMKHWGGERKKQALAIGSKRHMALLVVLVNILTNPLAVLLCWLGRMYLPGVLAVLAELVVEAAVVAAEAGIYHSFMEKPGWQTGRPLLLSAVTNVCSWTAGIAFGGWIDLAVSVFLRMRQAW